MMRLSHVPASVSVACALVLLALTMVEVPSAHAQLFGGRGIFGNRPEPPPRRLTEEEIGVPFPKSGRVQAVKGQEVRFEIEAISKAPGAAVEFLVRTPPSAGRIVSLIENPNARNRAIVTYIADTSSSADADVFGFAVRYRGGRYSSEVRFDIDLVDVRAELQSEPEIDFGEVVIGEEVIREIAVRNLGSGDFRRQIYLTPPWRIVKPDNGMLQISPQQTRMVKVGFRPTMEGETSYFLSFSRTKAAMTEMKGTGIAPFTLETPQVELTLDSLTGERVSEVVVVNRTEKPIRVSLRGSDRIQKDLPKMALLPPRESHAIPVRLPASDTAPFDGMLQLYLDSGFTTTARTIAAVVPGNLEVSIPQSLASDVINFGRIEAGRSLERGLRVTNTGGASVPLEFHIPDPFRLLNDPGPQLAPNASVDLAIGLFPSRSRSGPVDVTMNVLGPSQSLPIRLLANVIKSDEAGASPSNEGVMSQLGHIRMGSGSVSTNVESSPPPIGRSSGTQGGLSIGSLPEPEVTRTGREPVEIEGLPGIKVHPWIDREVNAELRSPEDLSVLEADAKSVTVGWTAPPNSELGRFDVELMGMTTLENGSPASVWVPIEGVKFDRVDRLVKAEIEGLVPASSYFLRVFTVDENGRASLPSKPMEVTTELPMDWTYIYLVVGLVVLGGIGWGVRRILRDHRAEIYQAKFVDA